MIRAFYASGAAMSARQRQIDIIANNVANANTAGYKTLVASFEQLMMAHLRRPDTSAGGRPRAGDVPETLAFGCGVRVAGDARDWDAGVSAPTGRLLDFALEGEGFFAIRRSDGTIRYTRAGQFHASLTAGGFSLVTPEGEAVLDQDGDPITLAGKPEDMEVGPFGEILMNGAATGITLGRFRFATPGGLLDDGYAFLATEASGPAIDAAECRVRQGALESSNVDIATEMTELISGQRLYQMNAMMLSWADEVENMSIRLRG